MIKLDVKNDELCTDVLHARHPVPVHPLHDSHRATAYQVIPISLRRWTT